MREYFDPTRAAKAMNESILDLDAMVLSAGGSAGR